MNQWRGSVWGSFLSFLIPLINLQIPAVSVTKLYIPWTWLPSNSSICLPKLVLKYFGWYSMTDTVLHKALHCIQTRHVVPWADWALPLPFWKMWHCSNHAAQHINVQGRRVLFNLYKVQCSHEWIWSNRSGRSAAFAVPCEHSQIFLEPFY